MLAEFKQQALTAEPQSRISATAPPVMLLVENWVIQQGQHWAVVGGSDEQRSAVRRALATQDKAGIAEISMAQQQRFVDDELRLAQTGLADEIEHGNLVADLVAGLENRFPAGDVGRLVEQLGFGYCLPRHFRELSSGETRRLLWISALAELTGRSCALLILQDPYEGLDTNAQPTAERLLSETVAGNGAIEYPATSTVFIASRPAQLPTHTTHLAYIDGKRLLTVALECAIEQALEQLPTHILATPGFVLPPLPDEHPFCSRPPLSESEPLVALRNITVSYADNPAPILQGLDWTVMPGEHWQLRGPNGSGKTTLLKLISGDHPQVYCNDVTVFGYRRGSGESLWDVRRYFGLMSSETVWGFHSARQITGLARDVVISGLYDSVGLYTRASVADITTANDWLSLLGIGHTSSRQFTSLGQAEQRLVLIARAMVKRPALLILDEPLLGLDTTERARVIAIIEQLASSGDTTVLYVSHEREETVHSISRVLELPGGQPKP